MVLSDAALVWLEIASAKGIGPGKWVDLSRSMPLEEIVCMLRCEEGRERLSRRLGRAVEKPDIDFVAEQIKLIEKESCGLVSISDDDYPKLLREIADPPLLLYHGGELSSLSRPTMCIVGSRRATRRGLITAKCLAEELSERGIHIVSGLARGIDSAAHEGALAGRGGTSAVLGCGIDIMYPPEHAGLAEEIAKTGSIVSEFPLGTPPLKHHFPQRNRVLSGLSLGVVVIEADLSSGAMGTARWALEQNREVFAVPGPIDYPGSRGPHLLIREGARLVEGVEDILAELPPFAAHERVETSHGLSGTAGGWRASASGGVAGSAPFTDEERTVLAALDLNPKHIDELVQFCHISPAVILPLLLGLEMRGVIVSCGGGAYALVPGAGIG